MVHANTCYEQQVPRPVIPPPLPPPVSSLSVRRRPRDPVVLGFDGSLSPRPVPERPGSGPRRTATVSFIPLGSAPSGQQSPQGPLRLGLQTSRIRQIQLTRTELNRRNPPPSLALCPYSSAAFRVTFALRASSPLSPPSPRAPFLARTPPPPTAYLTFAGNEKLARERKGERELAPEFSQSRQPCVSLGEGENR